MNAVFFLPQPSSNEWSFHVGFAHAPKDDPPLQVSVVMGTHPNADESQSILCTEFPFDAMRVVFATPSSWSEYQQTVGKLHPHLEGCTTLCVRVMRASEKDVRVIEDYDLEWLADDLSLNMDDFKTFVWYEPDLRKIPHKSKHANRITATRIADQILKFARANGFWDMFFVNFEARSTTSFSAPMRALLEKGGVEQDPCEGERWDKSKTIRGMRKFVANEIN